MRGFDDRWVDYPDYLLGTTHEIWEKRGLTARMRDYYSPNVVVRTPGGVRQGEPAVSRDVLAGMQEFPDRKLLGEDVIWSGDPDAGMLGSLRCLSTATRGSGAAGSRQAVSFRSMWDCYGRDNQICDAWLVSDTGAVLAQTGQDPQAYVRDLIEKEGGPDAAEWPLTPHSDVQGPYNGRGNDNASGERLVDLLSRLVDAEFSAIPKAYDRACHLEYAGGMTGHGHAAADQFWLPLRAAFPSAEFRIEHVIGRDDPMMPPRAAVRWSMWGAHDGWGAFGAPTGAEVYILGITHAEFGPRGLRREYTLYDIAAVWKQILLATE